MTSAGRPIVVAITGASGAPYAVRLLEQLVAREQHIFERYTVSLASLLAEETGARAEDVEARVVANALIGVHRALIDEVRRRVLAGEDDLDRLARDLRAAARRALRRLESGLGSYGRRAR